MFFGAELGEFLLEPVGLEFCEQRLQALHVEGTAVLRGIAAVFRESDLNLVADQYGRLVWCLARDSNRKPKTLS